MPGSSLVAPCASPSVASNGRPANMLDTRAPSPRTIASISANSSPSAVTTRSHEQATASRDAVDMHHAPAGLGEPGERHVARRNREHRFARRRELLLALALLLADLAVPG